MKDISRKSIKLVLNMLKSELTKSRSSLKDLQSDKNCNLECYEKVVDKCKELEYTIEEIKELL